MAYRHRTGIAACLLLAVLLSGCTGAQEPVPTPVPPTTAPQTLPPQKPSLEEAEIYSEHGISITVKALDDGYLGPEIQLQIQNDSQQNITVTTRMLSVNTYMMDMSGLYADVAAGKKSRDTLSFYDTELKKAGIETLAEVEFHLHISNSDSHTTIADSPLVKISTSAAGTLRQPVPEDGREVYSQDGIRVVSLGLKKDIFWEGTLVMFLENASQQAVTVYAENVSINGYMTDSAMWCSLRSGTRAVDGIAILDLEGAGLTQLDQVEELAFTLRIIDADTWQGLDTTDVITLTFD